MSVEYVEGGLPLVWMRFPSVDDDPGVHVCDSEEWLQSAPLDLSVRRRHCEPKPEIAATGSDSPPAFKKSILKRYSEYTSSCFGTKQSASFFLSSNTEPQCVLY